MRYTSNLTVKDRLYWADRSIVFEILALRDLDGRARMLELECIYAVI
jgi:hypothetical protein